MCGLVGAAGLLTSTDEKIFTQLLIADFFRGSDSTGVFVYDDEIQHLKKAVDPITFAETSAYNRAVSAPYTKTSAWFQAWSGHNRAATKGSVTTRNAHPFEHGAITLVHNGTLRNQSLLPDSRQFSVDSENICYAIDKQGLDKTLPQLSGAFALVWWDDANETLNFIRNDERPLHIAYVKGANKIYWASESKMLDWILERNKVLDYEIVSLPVMQHLSIAKDLTITTEDKSKLAYVTPVFTGRAGGTSAYNNQALSDLGLKQGDVLEAWVGSFTPYPGNPAKGNLRLSLADAPYSSVVVYNVDEPGKDDWLANIEVMGTTTYKTDDNNPMITARLLGFVDDVGRIDPPVDDDIPFSEATVTGYGGVELTRSTFDNINVGCACCGTVGTFDDALKYPDEYVWVAGDTYICYDCSSTPLAMEYIEKG